MVVLIHMPPRGLRRVEPIVTSLALKGREVMIIVVHVVLCVLLTPEFVIALLAFPVADGIHVLACGCLGTERSLTPT
jgi:hypothetical protein